MQTVSVLFARSDSVYKSLPGCDVWDMERDARNYNSDNPVIAHPPCRAWGSCRNFAKPLPGEKDLAFFALDQVRRCGGVLEHPLNSSFWQAANLPPVGSKDPGGGLTICVDQFWFGHMARKRTLLYIFGLNLHDLPAFPLTIGRSPRVVTNNKNIRPGDAGYRKEIIPRHRDQSPIKFASWLWLIAQKIDIPGVEFNNSIYDSSGVEFNNPVDCSLSKLAFADRMHQQKFETIDMENDPSVSGQQSLFPYDALVVSGRDNWRHSPHSSPTA